MAQTDDDPRTVDDVFQFLTRVRDYPSLTAVRLIRESLQLGKLQVDFHIRGGAWKPRPKRQATVEELQKQDATQAVMDHLYYEQASPEGIHGRIHPEAWDGVFGLSIEDEKLIILPKCPLDFPWEAYSFTITDWRIVTELWPPRSSPPSPELTPASGPPVVEAAPPSPPSPQPSPPSPSPLAPAAKPEVKPEPIAKPAKGAPAKAWMDWAEQALPRRRGESDRSWAERISKEAGLKRKTFQNLLKVSKVSVPK
jgi:hypothetical protein